MDILLGSLQDLGTILAKILSRYYHGIHFTKVKSYQENHAPKEVFIIKSNLASKNLTGSQQKSTSLQICIVRHENFLLAKYKV